MSDQRSTPSPEATQTPTDELQDTDSWEEHKRDWFELIDALAAADAEIRSREAAQQPEAA